jgi:hydrogenase nickel incorporation protein HypA/HybF
MHEFSMMRHLVLAAVDAAEKNGVSKVYSLTVQIGELTFLAREQLEFAYEVITKDTILAGSKLILEDVPASIRCPHCEYEGPLPREKIEGLDHHFPVLTCPECSCQPEIVKGKECTVTNMSAEVEGTDG